MTLGTLKRMLDELDVDPSLPVHVHVAGDQGWTIVALKPVVGRAEAPSEPPSAVLLAVDLPSQLQPYADEEEGC